MQDADDMTRILMMGADGGRYARQLALAGWKVLCAPDEIKALSAARNHQVDLALLHLPVDETVCEDLPAVLRRVSPAADLPVMIIADSPAEEQRCRFLDSGADDVICATTGPPEIVARIGSLLRIKRLHDQLAASRAALEQALERERKLLAKLRRDNERLQLLAITDPLTRVQNVRSFRDILRHEFRTAKRYDHPLSLFMLDVDHFKVVNDTHGHPSGDYVLKETAVILKQSVRESDVVCRTGGEEFSVILPRAGHTEAATFAGRIRKEVRKRRFIVYGETIHITTSIGTATFPTDAEIVEPDMLVYFADKALLHAKETGRDRVAAFHEFGRSGRARLRRQYRQMTEGSVADSTPA